MSIRPLSLIGLFFVTACSSSNHPSAVDVANDAGAADSNTPDSNATDANATDASNADEGEADANDATIPDGPEGGACPPGRFVWATAGGGPGQNDSVEGVAADNDGNVWFTGTFIGSAKWGEVELTSADKVHTTAFVAKADPTGKVLFAKALGGADDAIGNDGARVRLDAQGNAYLLGTFEKTLNLGSISLNGQANGSVYLIKLDPNGNPLWGRQSMNNGGSDEIGHALFVDAEGNAYIAGSYNGDAVFGGKDTKVANGGDEKVFAAKYDKDGNIVWAKGWIGTDIDGGVAYGIVANADGTSVLVGDIRGTTLDFDGHPVAADSGAFIVKLGTDGAVQWATEIAPDSNQTGAHLASIVADAAGNFYVTGSFKGTATLEGVTSVGNGPEDAGAGTDAGLAADGGAVEAAVGAEGGTIALDSGELPDGTSTGDAGGSALVVSVTGTGQDMLLAKYDSTGHPLWVQHAGVDIATVRGSDIAFDGTSGLYVAGFKQGATVFGDQTLAASGNFFVAQYDTSGAIQWVTGNDAPSAASGDGLAIWVGSPTSGVIAGGSFDAVPTTFGSIAVTSAGEDDGFVTKLCN